MENKSCYEWIIRNNFADADFWLINKGSEDSLGEPVREFRDCLTGLKCPALILPDYGFYVCKYLYDTGFWQQYAIGSTGLKNLRISTISKVFQEIGYQHKSQNQERLKFIVVKQTA